MNQAQARRALQKEVFKFPSIALKKDDYFSLDSVNYSNLYFGPDKPPLKKDGRNDSYLVLDYSTEILAIYLPNISKWFVSFIEKDEFDQYYESFIGSCVTKLPDAFTGKLNYFGKGPESTGGKTTIKTYSVVGGPVSGNSEFLTLTMSAPIKDNQLDFLFVPAGAIAKNQTICVTAISNGEGIFSVWQSEKGWSFKDEFSFLDIQIGEKTELGKFKNSSKSRKLQKSLNLQIGILHTDSARKLLNKEVRSWPKKRLQSGEIPAHSLFTKEDIVSLPTMTPFGFIPNSNEWNKKTSLYLSLLYRGKNIILPVNLFDLPANWNGKGTLDLEGASPDSLAILSSSTPKFVVQGQVGSKVLNFEEFQIKPLAKKNYYSLVTLGGKNN